MCCQSCSKPNILSNTEHKVHTWFLLLNYSWGRITCFKMIIHGDVMRAWNCQIKFMIEAIKKITLLVLLGRKILHWELDGSLWKNSQPEPKWMVATFFFLRLLASMAEYKRHTASTQRLRTWAKDFPGFFFFFHFNIFFISFFIFFIFHFMFWACTKHVSGCMADMMEGWETKANETVIPLRSS